MPTYQYACTECADQIEIVQKFTDDPLSVCSACGGRLRKVFSPVGIVFKGSGFYRTDSRSSSKDLAGAGQKANGAEAGPKAPSEQKSGESPTGKSGAGGNGSPGAGASASSGSGAASGNGSSPGGKPAPTKVA